MGATVRPVSSQLREWSMDEQVESNRSRKVEGRERKRRYQSGTRAYLHAMTNSRAKRFEELAAGSDKRREAQHERSE
jgi:hypothetical protein